MNGGTISGNGATSNYGDGGGVNNNGDFTMNSGTISGNSASNSGGGVDNAHRLVISGTSQIVNNQADTGYGGGILNNPFNDLGAVIFDGTGAAIKSNQAHLPDTLPVGAQWYQGWGVYFTGTHAGTPTITNGFDYTTQVTDNTHI